MKLRKLKKHDTVFHATLGLKEVYITDYNDKNGLNIKVHHKWYNANGESRELNGEKVLFNDEMEYEIGGEG